MNDTKMSSKRSLEIQPSGVTEQLHDQPEPRPSKYVVFEGIDGCGKTTQINAIRDILITLDHDVIRLREPTKDSPWGKYIREMFASGKRPSYDDEVWLFERDRRWHMEHRVIPALSLPVIILQDRSYFSTAAYQGYVKYTYHDLITMHETFAVKPDVVILLDMSVEQAAERMMNRGENETAMEKQNIQERVRATFLNINKDYHKSHNIILVNANQSFNNVTKDILSELKKQRIV